MNTGRNDPCPCGSGRKYKQCCLGRDQAAQRSHAELGLAGPAGGARGDGVWQVDLTPVGARIANDPAARPAVVLVVSGGYILNTDALADPPAEAPLVAAILERAVAGAASAAGGWPERVEVRDAAVARHLQEALAPRGVEVVRRPRLDELDRIAAEFREDIFGFGADMPPASSPETWRGWGLPAETVAEIFRAAAEYWRRRPWEVLLGEEPLLAEAGTSTAWTCCILGEAGREFGVGLYSDLDDFVRIAESGGSLAGMTGRVLSLTYSGATEVPRPMRREIASAGWEIAGPDAYPIMIAINTPGGGVTAADAQDLIGLLRAIPPFVERHIETLTDWGGPDEPVRWTPPGTGVTLLFEPVPFGDVGGSASEPSFHLYPCLPEGPNAEPEAAVEFAIDPPPDLDTFLDAEMRLVDRFEDYLAESLSRATVTRHAENAATFVHALVFHLGAPLSAVTEYDLRTFLFDLYHAEYSDSRVRGNNMPVSLSHFFRFLEEREGIRCPWAAGVLAERDSYAERLAELRRGDERFPDSLLTVAEDLVERAMLHWPLHSDGTPWGPKMGPVEEKLERELTRRWLLWREEVIRRGITDASHVREELIARQNAWDAAPHPRLEGESPLSAVRAEQRRRQT